MSWNKERIHDVAFSSAAEDYAAFEAIGLSEIEGARVLDVGCFDGFNTHLKFAPYENIAQVTGIDPQADAIAQAQAITQDARFSWQLADCEDFDGPDDAFDLVYFSHSFQHLADKAAGLDNAMRMLKPGGFIVIKTVDDAFKSSYPDPDGVMRRLFSLYELHILPNTPHTAHTDRYNGSKCYSLLANAGFSAIAVRTTMVDTAGKTLAQRKALFDRCTYFRRRIPEGTSVSVARQAEQLLDDWEHLFERDDYYFSSTSFVVVAQKPDDSSPPKPYFGPLFGSQLAQSVTSREGLAPEQTEPRAYWSIEQMVEGDLGRIMQIELRSFPDPWTPIAYAMELRYNPQGSYAIARGRKGEIGGYVGWWMANGSATIANIAVDPGTRRNGVGKLLLEHACACAAEAGCCVMQLQVRAENLAARSFYSAMGFREVGTSLSYYANPDDDAIILAKPLF